MTFRDEQSIIDDLADRYTVSQLALAIYCRIIADAPSYSECSFDEVLSWFSRRAYNGHRRSGMGEHYSAVFDYAERDLGPTNPALVEMRCRYEQMCKHDGATINDVPLIDALGPEKP